jgi:class 3 adenylate cyclase/tetratricopeptide (TPR) repeat protein
MTCPKCHYENPDDAKFCIECGSPIEFRCPKCGSTTPVKGKFCKECGQDLSIPPEPVKTTPGMEGERKFVTVLFSDLSGYTSMAEKLDPEEVREIMSRIFGEIAQVVARYEGFIEKFVGDAVMALFGVPKAHEDDPIRAIRSAREIHDIVQDISPEIEEKIGKPITVHSGINTGLVVTGKIDLEKGTHGVSGDAINLASRLCGIAGADEIIVGADTWLQTEGHFSFESLQPASIKGKADPVQAYRLISAKEKPETLHRLSGVRADLVGRKSEMEQLREAVDNLGRGKGRIVSISGDAGTGKSRLLREFKTSLDLGAIQWFEGHAYAYAQNIPYFPLIDMMNRVFLIDESDPPKALKDKLESGLLELVANGQDVIPYLGSLYSITYGELEDVNPELWKSRLKNAVKAVVTALAQKAPTVFCLEDLHWADPSSINIFRYLLLEMRDPALVLCAYRPSFNLFTTHQVQEIKKIYQEIQLKDLSISDTQQMLKLLLDTEEIPSDLQQFVRNKAEGNPFYLEELVNSLIESGTLIRPDGKWRLIRSIQEAEISSTIHGVISGRLDRLEIEAKRVLQEASVIGRAFLYDILKMVTDLREKCDTYLSGLERSDLIKIRSLDPELEYVFKHALTQEVVYNGLLKKEREEIHGRIARVIEELFQDRLPEFYETLAFHYRRSPSKEKAADYLAKAGKKSLGRYAVEEAHQYFGDAYEILQSKAQISTAEMSSLFDLLNDWGYVFYYLGDIDAWLGLLTSHQELAESLKEKEKLGMFYAWYGVAILMAGNPKKACDFLLKAKRMGEKTGDQKVIGYACTWLTWAYAELAHFQEAALIGKKAQEIAKSFPSDQYLFFKSLGGIGWIHWMKGDIQSLKDAGKRLLAHGERYANSRSKVIGYYVNAMASFFYGDIPLAIRNAEKSIEVCEDPLYLQFGRGIAGVVHLFSEEFEKARIVLDPMKQFGEKGGCGQTLLYAYVFLGPVLIAQGHMKQGMALLDKARHMISESQRKVADLLYEYVLGKIFALIATGSKPGLGMMAKNIGFLMRNVPNASNNALDHFNRAVELSRQIDSKGFLGLTYLELGRFYQSKKEIPKAIESFSNAARLFKEIGAAINLKRAEGSWASLK